MLPMHNINLTKGEKSMKKKLIGIFTVLSLVSVMAVGAFAEDTAMQTALTTGLTSASTSILGSITAILPIALGILAAVFGVKYGIRFFKSISKG